MAARHARGAQRRSEPWWSAFVWTFLCVGAGCRGTVHKNPYIRIHTVQNPPVLPRGYMYSKKGIQNPPVQGIKL